jgi:hypothetical protein
MFNENAWHVDIINRNGDISVRMDCESSEVMRFFRESSSVAYVPAGACWALSHPYGEMYVWPHFVELGRHGRYF